MSRIRAENVQAIQMIHAGNFERILKRHSSNSSALCTHVKSHPSLHCKSVHRTQHMEMSNDVLSQATLVDSHGHPQLDSQNLHLFTKIKATAVAVMGVNEGDWENVERLFHLSPNKVIPCFGVHPWWSHLHAASEPNMKTILEKPPEKHMRDYELLLSTKVSATWEARLRQLLTSYPKSIVGEFGIDRASVISGTKVQTCVEHQMNLFKIQMEIANEYRRPVSIHCVRGYGQLEEYFRGLDKSDCPPRVMLHSYGGSVEVVRNILRIPQIGDRFYFGFSSVINKKNTDKLIQRIQAIPDDRLLIESDEVTISKIDDGLVEILKIVASAKNWPLEHAAKQTSDNFYRFYDGFVASDTL